MARDVPDTAPASRRGDDTLLAIAMSQGDYGISYQPIFDLKTGAIFAKEALLRPQTDAFPGPLEMVHAAVEEGRIGEFGRMLRDLAVAGCPDHALFINAHPHEFDQKWLVQPDDPVFQHGCEVFLEVTEGAPLRELNLSHGTLRELARRGVNVVVDDLGAGYSNLRYLIDLDPKIVKLDRDMLRGIEHESRVIRLLRGLVRMCEDLGSRVVAEGIETKEQLDAIKSAGVHYGQGYFLERPSAVPFLANQRASSKIPLRPSRKVPPYPR